MKLFLFLASIGRILGSDDGLKLAKNVAHVQKSIYVQEMY
jgi:hypothetical protein